MTESDDRRGDLIDGVRGYSRAARRQVGRPLPPAQPDRRGNSARCQGAKCARLAVGRFSTSLQHRTARTRLDPDGSSLLQGIWNILDALFTGLKVFLVVVGRESRRSACAMPSVLRTAPSSRCSLLRPPLSRASRGLLARSAASCSSWLESSRASFPRSGHRRSRRPNRCGQSSPGCSVARRVSGYAQLALQACGIV